ncbi:hypothetical protein [Leptospira meyeri]|uniref:Uncharacterized protein n=1 Tax=Leptospira meyeri TaxID=29508 RepID=A0A4R8MMQ8_LEPME|nr:hypothetical protein [Leptospira meyeri]EKJ87767.1 hypothetical protein LEP1GSC017_0828 [Leptospira meyeri serovar Hardjo str. Went 5]EMJ89269.1 hypothetical protein LEP1GSC196_2580 [Leptospira meyeri serovar Semaranga str. Veldrot Semarang 173]TDY68724.1 hypothetical protein CLV96_3242 [Leptospira meyeri]TGL50226.1 hypothetical protein EHQ55_08120 [Leptospira meyeri]
MKPSKIITIGIKELAHQKVILAAWYNFLKENFDAKKVSAEEFTLYLQAHVMYDLDKDQIELMLSGPEMLLEDFKKSIFG